jgi:hypothetical protein
MCFRFFSFSLMTFFFVFFGVFGLGFNQFLLLSNLSLLLFLDELISLLNSSLPASLPIGDLVLSGFHAKYKPLVKL